MDIKDDKEKPKKSVSLPNDLEPLQDAKTRVNPSRTKAIPPTLTPLRQGVSSRAPLFNSDHSAIAVNAADPGQPSEVGAWHDL